MFKNRCRKSYAKKIGKSSKKSSKMDAKTVQRPSKKPCGKNVEKRASAPVNPGPPAAPVRDIRATEENPQRKIT